MHYSIRQIINNMLWEAWQFNRISWWNFSPTHFISQVIIFNNRIKACCHGHIILYYMPMIISVWVFLSSSIMWNGRWIWYFAIEMPKFFLWWEILNINIHSHNGNIEAYVSWSTKLTAPIVCCWYGRSSSLSEGGQRHLSNLFYNTFNCFSSCYIYPLSKKTWLRTLILQVFHCRPLLRCPTLLHVFQNLCRISKS